MTDYKAIIFDLDGTAIPLAVDGRPSTRVVESVKKAQQYVKVCAATGRSISHARYLLDMFDMKDTCVLSGGTQIIDPSTGKSMWEKRLSEEQVKQIIELCLHYPYPIAFSDEMEGIPAKNKKVNGSERIIYIWGATEKDAHYLQKTINQMDGMVAHIPGSWTKGRLDIHVTHIEATKKHALEELINMLGVKKEEIIGVGDQDNDLPLFESVGFKVAMGNATERLKQKADYVTTSVADDGLAEVIDKFILHK